MRDYQKIHLICGRIPRPIEVGEECRFSFFKKIYVALLTITKNMV